MVLLYRLTGDIELGESAIKIFSQAGIPCWHVVQEQLGEAVGALMSTSPEGKGYNREVPERSVMVFPGLTPNRLDRVLNCLYSVDLRDQAMKVAVIETNRTWAFGELLHELIRERETIRRQLQGRQDKAKAGQEQSE